MQLINQIHRFSVRTKLIVMLLVVSLFSMGQVALFAPEGDNSSWNNEYLTS